MLVAKGNAPMTTITNTKASKYQASAMNDIPLKPQTKKYNEIN